MREIVLDTETTGLDPESGDRIVEIGCVEIYNFIPTGRTFQKYINPQRDMSEAAQRITGITDDFLKDKPVFADIVDDFIEFIGDSDLVIHNAEFDMKFLNYELKLHNREALAYERAIDTLSIARKKFPGSPASLDALCKRFKVDLSGRQVHGGLLDSYLLAEVYLQLVGGRQQALFVESEKQATRIQKMVQRFDDYQNRVPFIKKASTQEEEAHQAFLETIVDPLWNMK